MRYVIVIVKPFRAEQVVEVLDRLGGQSICASEVKGYGRQKEHLSEYALSEFALTFLPKIKIEGWLPADRIEEAIQEVAAVARTGRIGDGKMFVFDQGAAVRGGLPA